MIKKINMAKEIGVNVQTRKEIENFMNKTFNLVPKESLSDRGEMNWV